ncbi:MAG: hypothetical protein ACLQNV_20640, partial [Steroidobacteraceae bacterium]
MKGLSHHPTGKVRNCIAKKQPTEKIRNEIQPIHGSPIFPFGQKSASRLSNFTARQFSGFALKDQASRDHVAVHESPVGLPRHLVRRSEMSAIGWRIQSISATPSNPYEVRRCAMVTSRIWFTAAQKAELWERWKNGQSAAA